jgi:hypothetical protein
LVRVLVEIFGLPEGPARRYARLLVPDRMDDQFVARLRLLLA